MFCRYMGVLSVSESYRTIQHPWGMPGQNWWAVPIVTNCTVQGHILSFNILWSFIILYTLWAWLYGKIINTVDDWELNWVVKNISPYTVYWGGLPICGIFIQTDLTDRPNIILILQRYYYICCKGKVRPIYFGWTPTKGVHKAKKTKNKEPCNLFSSFIS